MTNNYFIEEKRYEKSELMIWLSVRDLEIIILKGILVSEINSAYKFVFVGVVSLGNMAFIVFPKILNKEEQEFENIKATVQSLKKYSNLNIQKFDGIDYFNYDPDSAECSEMAIADFLINDFKKYGIYAIEQELVELNGNGDINWPLTVLSEDPVYSHGQPIYINTINHVYIDDTEHLTIAVHKWAIGFSLSKYSSFLGEDSDKIDLFYTEDLNEIGSQLKLIQHLKNQLQSTYTDRGIRVLKSLLYLIERTANQENDCISLYGTKKYSGVWEAICKNTVNDLYPQIKNDFDFFPNPLWHFQENIFKSKSPLIPDIIAEKSPGRYHLYDAKYYSLQFYHGLKGEPGFKDILKQFQYEEHIEKKLGKLENAFLFPISDSYYDEIITSSKTDHFNEFMAVIGYIDYHLYPDKKISIIICPFCKWQELFINNQIIHQSMLLP